VYLCVTRPEDSLAKLHVLVIGATARQGSAVVRALLQGGHRVRAMTRNLVHPVAGALRLRGARLAWVDLDEPARVADAMAGMDAVFALTPAGSAADAAREVERGVRIVEMAARAGVGHMVYASDMGAVHAAGVPRLERRKEIEAALHASGMPATVVCPAFFMENYLLPEWAHAIGAGRLPLALPPERKLQYVALPDLGRFVRTVLERAPEFAGQRACIASDELTPLEAAAVLARTLGHGVQHVPPDPAANPQPPVLYEDMNLNSGYADVVGLRRRYPEVNWHTLDGWARRQDWASATAQP
jgi:uncharacterized protein YbjT (DUF2867 family)